jgi:uncharacterized protein DUF1573
MNRPSAASNIASTRLEQSIMSRKHNRKAREASAKIQTNQAATVKPPYRRKMLYGVIAISIAAIAFGIYSSQSTLTPPGEAQAATASNERPLGGNTLASIAPFYNFGTVSMAGGNVTHRYTVSNLSGAPVTITKLFTSCMCTTATLVTSSGKRGPFGMPGHAPIPTIRERLAPGEMAQVDVVFNPAAHGPAGVGKIDRTVTIENDAGTPLELAFTAMVRP